MLPLRELQAAVGASILGDAQEELRGIVREDGIAFDRRLQVYRNNSLLSLTDVLKATFPVVCRLVDEQFFHYAADAFIRSSPPRAPCLSEYGGEFADFLAGFEPARELAYLPDVARFEWALSVAANAEDAPLLEPDALLGVQAEDHAALRFAPHPSVSCLELAYPADEIADAVLSGDEAAMAQVDLAYGSVCIVVHRSPNGLETERLCARSYEFVSLLCAGEPLGRVIEAAPEQAPMLLARQLAKGRLSAFRAPA